MHPAIRARPHRELGARIRKRRQALGWKQQELAERIGVHVNSVQKWEKGEQYPERHAGALEHVLGISLDEDASPPLPVPPELAAHPTLVDQLRDQYPDPEERARVMEHIAATLRGDPPPTEPGAASSGRSDGERRAG